MSEASQQLAEASAGRMYADDLASRGLGMEIESVAPGRAVLRMPVRADMVNGHDICHGGFIFTLADSAFAFACNTYGLVTVAKGASIEFVRPAQRGDTLRAEAKEISRGARTGIYDVEVRRQDGKLIACFRGSSFSSDRPIIPGEEEATEA